MEPTPQAMPSRPACLPQERRGLRVRSRPSATSTHREAFTRDRQYQQRLAPLTDLSKPEQPHPLLPGCELPRIEGDRQRNHHPVRQGIPRHPDQRRRTRLHPHRPQRPHRHPNRGRRGDHRPHGPNQSRWTDRNLRFGPRTDPLGEPSQSPNPTHRRPRPENEIRQHADPRQVRRRPGGRQDRGAGAYLAGVAGCPRAEDDHFLRPGDGELCSNDSFRAEGELHQLRQRRRRGWAALSRRSRLRPRVRLRIRPASFSRATSRCRVESGPPRRSASSLTPYSWAGCSSSSYVRSSP